MGIAAAMTEADFSRKVQKWLKERGAWVVKYHASSYTPKGVPDLIACYCGRFIGVELKTGSKVSDWQLWQGDRIRDAQGLWLVLSPKDFPHKLDEILKEVDRARRRQGPAG